MFLRVPHFWPILPEVGILPTSLLQQMLPAYSVLLM